MQDVRTNEVKEISTTFGFAVRPLITYIWHRQFNDILRGLKKHSIPVFLLSLVSLLDISGALAIDSIV
jgi:hypothetical protein